MSSSLHKQASLNILAYHKEGRLIPGKWSKEESGRHLGCLLHAAAGVKSVETCPADLMPRWMAEVTIRLYDRVATADRPGIELRYADLIGRWESFTPSNWDHVLRRWLVRVIDQSVDAVPASAKSENYWPAIAKACADVQAALKSGDEEALKKAGKAAARWAAARWAAARWAAEAAEAAEAAARWAAAEAAAEAAEAARWAAEAAEAAEAARWAAEAARWGAARWAAARWAAEANSKMFNALLDEIEAEINFEGAPAL